MKKRKELSTRVLELQHQAMDQEERQADLEDSVEALTARDEEFTVFLQDFVQRAHVLIQEGMET